MIIDAVTETPNEYPVTVRVRAHAFRADVGQDSGSTDSAPGPHDLFGSALASCKGLTAVWYAKRNNIPLERVEVHVESDASQERAGRYAFKVRLVFHGAQLSDEDRKRLHAAALRCPIHKLMTTSEVTVEQEPLGLTAPGAE